jgi:hypothetical protein
MVEIIQCFFLSCHHCYLNCFQRYLKVIGAGIIIA